MVPSRNCRRSRLPLRDSLLCELLGFYRSRWGEDLHKATTTSSQNHAIVYIEDLQARNKSKSAPGSIEDPGKNVRAKVGLNQSVFHQGWFKAARLQAEPERRISDCRSCARHEPMLPQVRALREETRKTQAKFGCVNCK